MVQRLMQLRQFLRWIGRWPNVVARPSLPVRDRTPVDSRSLDNSAAVLSWYWCPGRLHHRLRAGEEPQGHSLPVAIPSGFPDCPGCSSSLPYLFVPRGRYAQ